MSSGESKQESRREKRKKAWQTFKRTLPDAIELARPQARLWLFGLCLLVVGRLAGLTLPAAPKFLLDYAIPNRDLGMLYTIIGVLLAATIIQGICSFVLTQTISKAGQRLIAALRIKIQHHVSRLSVRYYDNHKTGEVVSRVMSDVEGVRNLVGTGMVEFLGGLLTAGLAFIALLYLNWQLTVAIAVVLGIFLIVMAKAFMTLGPIFKQRQEIRAEVSGRLTESVAGIRVVKAYNREEAERTVFARGVDRLLENVLRTINAISVVTLVSSVLVGALGATIVAVGGRQLIEGTLTVGDFTSYLLFLGFLIAPIGSIVMIGTQLSEAFAGLERIREVMEQAPEDRDDDKRNAMPPIRGEVEFDQVSFAYDAGIPVLHDVSFRAEPGTVTALVGPSGSGKSTLTGLVASFYQPTSGIVRIDGIDLNSVKIHEYRKQLGAVLQDNFLFDGTVRDNILYPRPEATEQELLEAARLAHCLEFIERFPEGFDTIIGERGVKVSGGQRQRLAIARSLLANPRILILDEATSALDSESEASIQEGLRTLMAGRTTFAIAHRLSTIRSADQILVLDGGRIVERGRHQELLAQDGVYARMYRRQHGVEENIFLAPGESTDQPADESPGESDQQRRDRLAGLSRFISGE